jgi:hypothetical protein
MLARLEESEMRGNKMPKKGATQKIYRSAKTGKFVTKKQVKNSPSTTVTETRRK